jgi:hypothetical protein
MCTESLSGTGREYQRVPGVRLQVELCPAKGKSGLVERPRAECSAISERLCERVLDSRIERMAPFTDGRVR